MFRNAWATLAGIVAAAVIYMLVNEVRGLLFAPPAGLDSSDIDSLRTYLSQLPFTALLLVFVRSILAAFIGTLVACYIGNVDKRIFGLIIGGIVLAYGVAFFIAVPFPLWLSLATLIGVVLTTLFAVRVGPTPDAAIPEPDDRDSDSG